MTLPVSRVPRRRRYRPDRKFSRALIKDDNRGMDPGGDRIHSRDINIDQGTLIANGAMTLNNGGHAVQQ